jgi:PAS domain S-box-containing protein
MNDRSQELLRELETQRQWFATVLSSIGDGVITADVEGRVTYLNPVAESLTGWSHTEAIGQPLEQIFRIVNEDTRRSVENPALRAIREGVIFGLANHTVLVARDGREIAIDDSGAPIRTDAGEVLGAVLVFQDVSARREAEAARAFLASIVDSSEDAIITKDLDGTVTSWNAAAERVFGYSAAEAIGQPITLIVPHDRRDKEAMILRRLREGDRIEHFETERLRKNGDVVQISLTVSPVRNRRGEIIGASKIARDSSDQRRADAERTRLFASECAARERAETVTIELRESLHDTTLMQQISTRLLSADNFSVLLDEILGAAIRITRAEMGNIQLLNDDVLTIVAHRGFEASFLEFFGTVCKGQAAACGSALQRASRVIVEDVSSSPLFDASSLHVMLAAKARAMQSTPLVSRTGRVLGMFSTHYQSAPRRPSDRELHLLDVLARQAADLIEHKQFEEAERRAKGEAEEANRVKDEFLAMVSHELRTPLNAILGWADMLRSGVLQDARRAHAIAAIHTSALRQSQLVGELLDMSRIMSGKLQVDRRAVNLQDVVQAALEVLCTSAEAKQLSITVDADPSLGAFFGDAGRLQQILSNLLSNAIKFTPDGGSIRVGVRCSNGAVEMAVTDTGQGIPAVFMPFVF